MKTQAEGAQKMFSGKSIVIFSQQNETADKLCLAAGESGFGSVIVSDGSSFNVLMNDLPSLVIVNAPLEKEFGLELAVNASGYGCGVIIAAPQKVCGEIAAKLAARDIFILPKPFNQATLLQAIRFVTLTKVSSDVLKTEKEQLETKLRDMKLIDRAKCVLVQYLRISEKEAHRQIQKRAMDMRTTQAEVAKDIIKTYEI